MNTKNYTPSKILFLIILPIIFLTGCYPKDDITPIIPPTPKQTESALPNIKKSKVDIDNTISNNDKVANEIENSKQGIIDQKISILEALAQAEKIKEKALSKLAITELDAINLINELKKVQSRNMFLEQKNLELSNLTTNQEKILAVIKNTLDKTEEQIIAKEQETHQLREQFIYLKQIYESKSNELDNVKKELQKEKQVSASAKTYRNIIWMIAGVWLLLLIIKNVLMSINPTARFRF
jgi:hypothetical protein